MTVKQLIEKLSALPQSLQVIDGDWDRVVAPRVMAIRFGDKPPKEHVVICDKDDMDLWR